MNSRITAIGLAAIAILALVPIGVSAAGVTQLDVTTDSEELTVGESTTVNIVVENATGGIGSYTGSLTLDSSVAKITNISLQGAPLQGGNTNISHDGSQVEFSGAVTDTKDTGAVEIASLSVTTIAEGTTPINLSMEALGDESGSSYSIAAINHSELSVESTSVDVRTEPNEAQAIEGNNRKIDIVADNVTLGVGSYEYSLTIENPAVAEIDAVTAVGEGFTRPNITSDNASVQVEGSALELKESNSTILGSVTLKTKQPGNTSLSLQTSTLGDINGNAYGVDASVGSILTVSAQSDPVASFENPPKDNDGDGSLDDVNGDGVTDVNDVTALWINRDGNVIQEYGEFYDYNNDGVFDVNDVTKLWQIV